MTLAAPRATAPFLDLRAAHAELAEEIGRATERVMASGLYLLGEELERFEAEFAAHAGARHCVAVGSGLDALRLALAARGLGAGDEAIVPGQTFIATWLAVSAVGARPVPVDVEPDTHLIDPDRVEAAITPRTRAIVPVDLYGHPAPHDALGAVARNRDVWLLDDAAQAHGARLHGRPVGSFCGAAAWSFYPGKNLGALGDGGAVTTDDDDLAARIRRLRNYGSEEKYVHLEPGANSRLDEVQAAVLRVKLERLSEWNGRRRAVADRYLAGLAGGPVELPVVRPGAEPSWHLFVIRSPRRDALREHLAARGVETGIHYPIPPHRQPAYRGSAASRAPLPVAVAAAREALSLPIGPHLPPAAVEHVIEAVRSFDA